MIRLLLALVAIVLVSVLAAACGNTYAGTYRDTATNDGQTWVTTLKLDSSGKFTLVDVWTLDGAEKIEGINPMTESHSGTYTIEGDKLKLHGDGFSFDGKVEGDGFVVGSHHFRKE